MLRSCSVLALKYADINIYTLQFFFKSQFQARHPRTTYKSQLKVKNVYKQQKKKNTQKRKKKHGKQDKWMCQWCILYMQIKKLWERLI